MAHRKTSFNTKANTYYQTNTFQTLDKQNSLGDEINGGQSRDDLDDQHRSINYQPSLPAPFSAPLPLPKHSISTNSNVLQLKVTFEII